LERFINWLQKWTCDIVEQRMLGRIRFNPDLAPELAMIAKRVEPLSALRLHRKLVREQRNIHHPLNARLYMESVLFAYAGMVNPSRRAA
ncbi:MAG: polymerase subunit delta, partial [Pseudomonadota bacterium]